ncbi:hypothetical protein BTN49_1900 [Candidatus Enterovibrio escicola]|uniref:Mobile element protein n=1 Tax=Candidatus Enterovibrio escicola TaxID=1927127 RepID=A0A2A5T2X1_9GAMM|nr:hypothetical protein BTN49_1900 [Candidatus Enterovibrio escacola]
MVESVTALKIILLASASWGTVMISQALHIHEITVPYHLKN